MSHTPASDNLQSGPVQTEAATHETTIKGISTHHEGTKRVNLPQRTKPKLSPHDLRTRRREYIPVENVEDTPVLHRITRDVVKVQVTTPAFQSEPISYSVNTPLSTSILATLDTSKEGHDKHGSKEHEHIRNDKNKETSTNEDGAANVDKESRFIKKRKHSKKKRRVNTNSGHSDNNDNNSYNKIKSNDSYSSSTSSANTDKENRSADKNDNKHNSNSWKHDNNNNNNKQNENDANAEGANSAERQTEVCNKSIVLLAPRELDINDDSYRWSELDKRIVNVHDTEKEDGHGSNNESSISEREEITIHEYAQNAEQDEYVKENVDDMGHRVNPIFVTAPVTQMRSHSEASTLESSHSSEKVVFAQCNVSVEHSTHIILGNEKEGSYTSIDNSSNIVTGNDLENVRTMDSDPYNGTSPDKHNNNNNNNNFANNEHKSRKSGDININNNNNTNNKFSNGTNQTKNNHNRYQSNNFSSPFTRADKKKFPGAKAVEEDVTSYKVKIFVGLGVVLGVGATIMLLRSIHKLDSAAARASETARGMFQSFKTYYVPYTHSASLSTRKVTLTTADEQRETVARIRERLISSKLKAVKY